MTDQSSQMLAKTCFGHSIYVKKNDDIGIKIINKGIYDKPGTFFMRALLGKIESPVMLDIGANIGNHLLSLSPLVSRAYAFEPQKDLFGMIEKSLSLNKITNCEVFPFGLSDEDNELTFYVNKTGNVGASSFVNEHVKGEREVQTLSVRKGDDVIKEIGLERLDFLKIDVEGFELNVFKGLAETLKTFSPLIAMEWDSPKTTHDFLSNDVFNTLLSGYNILGLVPKHSDQYWQGKPLWKLQQLACKLDVARKWRMVEFDPDQRYPNIILYKDHHKDIIQSIRNSRV